VKHHRESLTARLVVTTETPVAARAGRQLPGVRLAQVGLQRGWRLERVARLTDTSITTGANVHQEPFRPDDDTRSRVLSDNDELRAVQCFVKLTSGNCQPVHGGPLAGSVQEQADDVWCF
jgi:hypothetical protein